jgi:hypothetical protein
VKHSDTGWVVFLFGELTSVVDPCELIWNSDMVMVMKELKCCAGWSYLILLDFYEYFLRNHR